MEKLRGHVRYKHPFWEKKIPTVESMGKRTVENDWTLPELNLRAIDVSNMDLSGYDMQNVAFGEGTVWPKDPAKCPKDFDKIEQIWEYGKDPGLGIRSLHKKGIDGTGISMAIIDQPLSDHVEYHDNLVHYEEIGYAEPPKTAEMHGAAVSSIAVGKNCGVAPKAKLYYFADNHYRKDENGQIVYDADTTARALERILEINETLPDKEKIQVVSMSWGGQMDSGTLNSDKWKKALEKAKRAGLFVLTCASRAEQDLEYSKMGRRVTENPNDVSSYIETAYKPREPLSIFMKNHKEEWKKHEDIWKKNGGEKGFEKALEHAVKLDSSCLFIPSGHRTLASPCAKDEYVHYYRGGASWTTPWIAGMFVLARQMNPNITPEHFWKVAAKTGTFSKKVQGTVIQPQKLIETLQKELTPTTLRKTLTKAVKKDKMIQSFSNRDILHSI